MSDRICVHCDDSGNCYRCSWFFQPNKPHSKCGRLWRDHEVRHDPQGFYPPWTTCPQADE